MTKPHRAWLEAMAGRPGFDLPLFWVQFFGFYESDAAFWISRGCWKLKKAQEGVGDIPF